MAGPDPRRVPGPPGKIPVVPPLAPPQGQAPVQPPPAQPIPGQVPQYPAQYPQQAAFPQQGQFPQQQMPGGVYPQAPAAQAPYPVQQYPAAPQYPGGPYPATQFPGAPQFPGAQQFPGSPQFPTPAQYQGGFGAPAAPTYPGAAYPAAPQYPASPQYPGAPQYPAQYPGAPQYPAVPQSPPGGAYPAVPQYPGGAPLTAVPAYPAAPQYPGTVPTGVPQMPGAASPSAPQQKSAPSQKPAKQSPSGGTAGAPAQPTPGAKPQAKTGGNQPSRVAPATTASGFPTTSSATGAVNFRGIVGAATPGYSGIRQDEPESAAELARRHAIPVLVSFIVHLIVVIVLGILTFPKPESHRVIIQASIDDTPPPSFAEVRGIAGDNLEVESFRPLAKLPELPKVVKVPINLGVGLPMQSLSSPLDGLPAALAGRGMKGQLLGEKGGTIETEEAVENGLNWLAAHQLPNGHWSLTGAAQGGKGAYSKGAAFENHEAATAMALLAFLGAGHTPKNNSPHAKVVDRGIKAILRGQAADGNMFHGSQRDDHLYTQALCTMALCEYLALDPDNSELKAPCEKAVRYCVQSQSDSGGWKYTPRQDSDTSVTGWMLMALQSAKNAKVAVPQEAFDKITAYLDVVAKGPDLVDARTSIVKLDTPGVKPTPTGPPLGSRYGYMIGDNYDHVMTAEGLLCRMYLGWAPHDERLRSGVEYLLAEKLPLWEERDVYYWYYGTQLMFHMEGQFWNRWNTTLRDQLVSKQETTGREKGSWDPLGTGPANDVGADLWSTLNRGGRLYVTCFSLYMLEVYYRHLPLYSELKKQMEARQSATAAPPSNESK